MRVKMLALAILMAAFDGLSAGRPDIIDVHKKVEDSPLVLKMYAYGLGVTNFVKRCAQDTVYWIVSQAAYPNCASALDNVPKGLDGRNIPESFFKKLGGGCVNTESLPQSVAGTIAPRFLLTKQFAPCTSEDSSALAKEFGTRYTTRDVEENESSCEIRDTLTYGDTSSAVVKARAFDLGRKAHKTLPKGVSSLPRDSGFAFSPFVSVMVVAGCADKALADSVSRGLDARFRIVRVRAK